MLRLCTAVLCCLSLCGFLQAADDAAVAQDAADALFAEFPTVEAASLHTQSLLDAPASVTVISAEELQLFGYRTIGEALANVRGFYVSNDGLYSYLGLRGLSLPGDYSTRFLVMINGHYMTDNVYSSNGLLGQDFPLDWDLIQRIEVIRGPSSAIYGSNGVFATVNVVTRAPVDMDAVTLSTEVDARGAAKQHFSTSQYLGRGVNLLFSGSGFFNGGGDRIMDGVGVARDVGEEMGGHGFLHVTWKDWSVTAMGGQRAALVPTGAYGVVFNDRGNRATDARGFAELKYSKHFDSTRELRWRVYYDNYRYRATYRYDLAGCGKTTGADATWVFMELPSGI